MGVATVHLLFLSVVALAASGAPEDRAFCDAWCEDPPGSGRYKCCDEVGAPTAECPVDRRSLGDCTIDPRVVGPPNRCYANSDCSGSLLCCYDACLGQICKTPSSGGAAPVSAPPSAVTQPTDTDTDSVELLESGEFALQHISSGRWLQARNHDNNAHILINPFNENCKFKVERVPDTLLVHVKHVASGKYWHPSGGSSSSYYGTYVVLHATRPWYTQFTFNQDRQIIQHQSGATMAPDLKSNQPGTWTWLQDNEINAQFRVVYYNEPTKPFLIYGDADVTAYWVLVFSFETPASTTHTQSQTVQVGHSIPLSSSPPNIFAWEITAMAKYWFAEMASVSVAKEVRKSSAGTWSKSTTQMVEVPVLKGKTVALWQKVFKASQLGHFSVQQSNHFVQTNSNNIKPDDVGAEVTDLFV